MLKASNQNDINLRDTYFAWNPLSLAYEMYDFLKQPDIENSENFFYLDSNGKITFGIGEMIPNSAAGKKKFDGLQKYLYSDSSYSTPATHQQMNELWESLGKLQDENRGKYQHNNANFYLNKEGKKALYMDNNKIRELAMVAINKKIQDMIRMFPNIKYSPLSAQIGVLDLIYNVGAWKVRSQFHWFCQAVEEYDWAAAGIHSHRKHMPLARHIAVVRLFMKAALEERDFELYEAFRNGPRIYIAAPPLAPIDLLCVSQEN